MKKRFCRRPILSTLSIHVRPRGWFRLWFNAKRNSAKFLIPILITREAFHPNA
jgi:hypothetical protein